MRYMIYFALVCVLVPDPRGLAAQGKDGDLIAREAKHRSDCRLAAQALRTEHPAPKLRWAFEMIRGCTTDGPPVLVELWSDASLDSAQVDLLLAPSSTLRDQRLADALFRVAGSAERSDYTRLNALAVLLTLLDPGRADSFAGVVPPPGWSSGQNVRLIGPTLLSHDVSQLTGTVPLAPGLRERLLSVLHALREGDPSLRIRYVAAAIAEELEL